MIIDVLLIALYVAMTAVFMVNFNQPYLEILKKLKLDRKPMNCALCFSWWLGVIMTIAMYSNVCNIMIAPMSALLAIAIEKLVKMLPIIF